MIEKPKEQDPSQTLLGHEVIEGIGNLIGDTMLRSGLPLDTRYAKVTFTIRDTDLNISRLEIKTRKGGSYFIDYTNGSRGPSLAKSIMEKNEITPPIPIRDSKLHTHITVSGDGGNIDVSSSMFRDPTEAAEYLIRNIDNFTGSDAEIVVEVPKVS